MKRLILAAVLLLLIVTVCFLGGFTVLRTVKDFKNEIENCEQFYIEGNLSAAKKSAEDFKKQWHKSEKIISVFTNHRPLDDISILAATLCEAANENNDFEFFSAIEGIKTKLQLIYREESFNSENMY